jgi:hypothetical protein
MEKITANMRRLTIATQESGARLREPGKTLGKTDIFFGK